MRIISCYIENFGGLSHFTCNFNAGLTTIQQHNGFGKTTLAEYIRAMFYGFPRAGRSLEKNKRKRFKPWQGGKFGGNLVFEYEGTQYRIERTFGGSPATDTFAVYDLSTHKPCDKFSYDIGVDIFHLDADSFERSTYLPQLQDAPPMITDSIQAKLGELVDDTDDDNNFNHAVRALQAARSPLVPRKGQSGAQKKIAELEKFLADAGSRREELERLQTELAGKKKEHGEKEDSRDALLEKIGLASETAGLAAVQEQLDRLNAEYGQNEQAMAALREKYPDGLPSEEEIDALLLVYDDIAPLHARSVPSSAYETAKKNLEENARRFEHGVPAEADFQTYQGKYEEYTNKKAYLKNLSLTPQEQEKLAELETFFKAGVPDEAFLVTCQQKQQELRAGKTESLNQCLPAAEQARLNALEQFFRNGVPSDDDLFGKQRELQRINQLKQENNVMALATAGAARQEPPPAPPPPPPVQKAPRRRFAFLPMLLLGAIIAVAGVGMIMAQMFIPGGGLLGVGVVSLLAAMYLYLQDKVTRQVIEDRQASPQVAEITVKVEQEKQKMLENIRENQDEIRRLEHSLHRFLTRFDCAGGSTEEKLRDLQSRQREYLSLKKVADSFAAKQSDAQEGLEQASRWLEENLAPYFGPDLPLDPFATLHWKCSEYQALAGRRAESTERAASLMEEIQTLEQELRRFLEPYVATVEPDGFQSSLTALQRDCDTYSHNQTFVLNYERESVENRENLQIYTRQILDFAGKYKLPLDAGSRQAAFSIRDDVRKYAQLSASNGSLREEIDTFTEKNRGIIESPNVLDEYDLEELKTAKEQAEQDIADTASQILSLQQQIKQLQIDLDQIPQKEDELAGLRELCGESQRKAALLDDTIAMLKTAKDNMSANYLSIIRSSFSEYLHRVTGEASENIYINPQLDVRLERQGETRDIGYFSAGQADIILLCMRMALVRALFRGEKPFIVLDDPFVNLDDEKTTEALALLTDLSKEYQIIYLICHSSRTEEE